jgi:hypothetical protein
LFTNWVSCPRYYYFCLQWLINFHLTKWSFLTSKHIHFDWKLKCWMTCNFLSSDSTKMTYSTRCQIEHLIKIYFKMNIPIKMTFDLIKSDKGYLYYLSTLWVSLVKMAFGPIKTNKGYLYYVSTLGVSPVKITLGLLKKR